ncbi:hypothetical protein [Gordonia sp. QH-12]|uniref:hypothetical protein n=1 Tax=Gordonia sp. QH-12 TaxID=1437876 RepID=UPI0012E7DE3F|nr:hypothetical protein [Gordonia sp. QH-12]
MAATLTPPSTTSSPKRGLLGQRTPRVFHRPAGATDYSRGEKALDIAFMADATLLGWQEDVVREGMARDASGRWAAAEVGIEVSRQNGKTASIEVVELAWMITEPGVHILHTAHEFQTAMESMDRLHNLILSHPKLENQVLSVKTSNGKERIKLKNGSEIRYRTRTKSGGRGFSVDRLVIDEAMIWSKASQAAIRPLLTTAKDPQIWYLGSAADANVHEHCGKWASLRRAAMSEKPPARLLWMEWSAPEPPEPTGDELADALARTQWREDRENWAIANPSMGREVAPGHVLVTEEYIEEELEGFRNALDEWEIERLALGRWPADASAHEPIINADSWSDMTNLHPSLVGPVVIGLALSPDRRRWAIAAAQGTAEHRTHVEIGAFQPATHAELVEFVYLIVEAWDPAAVVIDSRSPAAVIESKLINAGIEPEMATTPQIARWSGGFLDDALAGLLSHTGQQPLTDAVATVAMKTLPQGDFTWVRAMDGSTAPIEATTLAHGGLVEFGGRAQVDRPLPSSGPKDTVRGLPRRSGELDVLTTAF